MTDVDVIAAAYANGYAAAKDLYRDMAIGSFTDDDLLALVAARGLDAWPALIERDAEIAQLRETLQWIADECAPGGHSGENGGWWQRLNAVGDHARAALGQEPAHD